MNSATSRFTPLMTPPALPAWTHTRRGSECFGGLNSMSFVDRERSTLDDMSVTMLESYHRERTAPLSYAAGHSHLVPHHHISDC